LTTLTSSTTVELHLNLRPNEQGDPGFGKASSCSPNKTDRP
jgi:hypothetical protein